MSDDFADIISPQLAPLFQRPPLVKVPSAWYGHIPFAQWLISVAQPRSLVELGTHNGVSYAAFCEAVAKGNLATRCYAVDTWQGDEHAGFYTNQVYEDFSRFHSERYATFSELLRCSFDLALPYIIDGTVDILHIDGCHKYEDVLHDFESWLPKLSDRAVVLFHDTNVRERNFGVFRLWKELSEKYPSFEFLHGHGLGVLACGENAPAAIKALTGLQDQSAIAILRERFSLLGERWITAYQVHERDHNLAQLSNDLANTLQWAKTAQSELDKVMAHFGKALEDSQKARAQLSVARHELAALSRDQGSVPAPSSNLPNTHSANSSRMNNDLRAALARERLWAQSREQAAVACDHAVNFAIHLRDEALRLNTEITNMRASRSWTVTKPLRVLQALMKGRGVKEAPPLLLPSAPFPEHAPPPPDSPLFQIPGANAGKASRQPGDAKRVLFISGESHTPGTIYRVDRMAELARSLGYQAVTSDLVPVNPEMLTGLDAIVIWRAGWSPHLQGIIEHARETKTAVFYDVDDLMFRPDLARIEIIDGIRSQNFSEVATSGFFGDVQKAMLLCDAIMCPTEELAEQARRCGMVSIVVPNGFSQETIVGSRRAANQWRETSDGLLRIGYAGGSRTHQKDFAQCADALADILARNENVRLVLFTNPVQGGGLVLLDEFPKLAKRQDKIEWRQMVTLPELPAEIARFDINLAPLEVGNPFCEAKSELKYFEAALVSVPTIASPTGPFRRAVKHGVTGLLAATPEEWRESLQKLIDNPSLRAQMALNAYHDSLAHFGPDARADKLAIAFAEMGPESERAMVFAKNLAASVMQRKLPHVPASELLMTQDLDDEALVTVIIPLYNYADYIVEALESVRLQTLPKLDLVIIDDGSSDDSIAMARRWLEIHRGRFSRVRLQRHLKNAGLGFTRNSGFCAAQTPHVLPLDADNRLLPTACEVLLDRLENSRASFVYPAIQLFGDSTDIVGTKEFSPQRLAVGNYIDAMALVRKSAWAEVGGYDHVQFGWEDYDFWCCLVELGRFGLNEPTVLAEYRVHHKSMLRTATDVPGNRQKLEADLIRRHPWLKIGRTK